jgi:hypothetical protein
LAFAGLQDMLLVGRFSPSKFPWRSGTVVLAVMLMFSRRVMSYYDGLPAIRCPVT